MASSGWQSELFATNSCFSDYVCWYVNLYVASITHTGTNLTITGRAAWCTRNKPGKSGGSTTFGSSYPCGLTPQGGVYYQVVAGGVKQSVGSDYYAPDGSSYFTVTIPNVAASATSYNYSCTWSAPGNNTGSYGGTTSGTVTWTLTFDASTIPQHLYGSVNGTAKEIKHLYGSVNGARKKVKKLYGSVNGVAKLIFKDDS